MKKLCSIEGCENQVKARGLCSKHYSRWNIHGDPSAVKFSRALNGVPQKFIDALPSSGEACITWPYAKNNEGYAQLGIGGGKKVLVSRLVCEKRNGPPPSDSHQAAHSCGKGHLSCVAPYHLAWKTPAENQADRQLHGTTRAGAKSHFAKLTEDQVRAIRTLEGSASQENIRKKFGISQTLVGKILRRECWKDLL